MVKVKCSYKVAVKALKKRNPHLSFLKTFSVVKLIGVY